MLQLLTSVAAIAGFLLGRAVAFGLTGMPVALLRRFITLILVVVCCGVMTAAWYLDQADVRHIIYAAALAALVGFVVSQRKDQTVRLVASCVVAPLIILGSLAVAFLACDFSGVIDWSDRRILYPLQASLCLALPIAFSIALTWYVPLLLWKVRAGSIQGGLRSIAVAVMACVGLSLLVFGYDLTLRRQLAVNAGNAAAFEQQLYGTPPRGDENAIRAYQKVVDEFENDDNTMLGFELAIADVRRTGYPPNLEQHQSRLDQLIVASRHPGRLYLTDEKRSMELQDDVFVLALGLIARAKGAIATDADAALEDLLAVRRIQRHLASDPQLKPFPALEMLEQRLRVVFEQIEHEDLEHIDLQSLGSQVPFDESAWKCNQNVFLARHLEQRYGPAPFSSSFSVRGQRCLARLLWCAHDLDCATKDQMTNLHMTIPDNLATLKFEINQEGLNEFHVQAAVNDIGLFCREFHAREGQAPTLADLPTKFQTLLGRDAAQVVEITQLSGGCAVTSAEDSDLAAALRNAEARDGAPPKTSDVLNNFGAMRTRRVFLVGDPLSRYRKTHTPAKMKTEGSPILFISPSNEQTFSLLSGMRRGDYSEALGEVRTLVDSKHQLEIHDIDGILASILNELCRLDPDDAPWFYNDNHLNVVHESGQTHRLAFWSLDDLQQRKQRLSEVRKDDFDDAFESVHWDYGTEFTEATATKTWNDLTKLADFVESALDEGQPVLCITVD